MVKVNTKYSKNLLRNFEIFHFFRKSIFKSILTIILIIDLLALFYFTGGLTAAIVIHYFKMPQSWQEVMEYIVALIIIMILPTIYFFSCKNAIKHLKQNYRIEKDMELEYEFGKNEVKVNLSTPFENDSFISNYKSVHKIYETSKYFYIYFSKYDLFILAKENLADGDLSKLENIFKANISQNKLIRR